MALLSLQLSARETQSEEGRLADFPVVRRSLCTLSGLHRARRFQDAKIIGWRMRRYIPNRHHGRQKISGKEKVFGDFRVRVILPDQKPIVWRTHAKPGHGYSAANIEDMLDQVAEHLEKRFPSVEFRMVELAPNVYNFIYEGRKEMQTMNACPETAQGKAIAGKICAEQGHDIIVYQTGMKPSTQGPVMESITICKRCGFGLNEIRGDVDNQIELAVQKRTHERLEAATKAAAAPPPVAGAKGPVPVPPANSPSEPTAS